MIPLRIMGATQNLGAPKGWDKDADGSCRSLAVRHVDGVWQSAWEPTPQELELLAAGGVVVLSIVGGQPPVMLTVEPPAIQE